MSIHDSEDSGEVLDVADAYRITGTFGSLIAIAASRHPDTLEYGVEYRLERNGAPLTAGEAAILHLQLWCEWSSLELERQIDEIDRFVCWLAAATGEPELMMVPQLYRKLTTPGFFPTQSTTTELEHFFHNVDFALGLILGAATTRALAGQGEVPRTTPGRSRFQARGLRLNTAPSAC